ncbi:Lipoprotein [Streptomyces venezuelae]|nr:Lipoprotein [Streptomyces venezuelae]CUM42974.1 putative lipoprotein [Streptomyces venezuelae]
MIRRQRAVVAVALSAVAVLALGACESGSDAAAPKAEASAGGSVVAPGKPGEPAKRISPEEAARLLPDERPNSADFTYTQMMIVHHRQALTMTELAPQRAGSPAVKKVAERISAAQQPEIAAMEGWLKNNGGPREQGGHDHRSMPGMATEAQLKELRGAKGKAFDELFLKLMITHHQGAVTMAAEVLSDGNNVLVEEMANDVIAQQTSEINRMQSL